MKNCRLQSVCVSHVQALAAALDLLRQIASFTKMPCKGDKLRREALVAAADHADNAANAAATALIAAEAANTGDGGDSACTPRVAAPTAAGLQVPSLAVVMT